ncbi:MAG: hypothetical protein M2R45_01104 [Verrucomicrobia subdivision 3 bacterium]|nr:hypothetical protein [Limisphaerales bacterium]MCS1414215.1 hypothetical protein [Limisphaerales bacterium]
MPLGFCLPSETLGKEGITAGHRCFGLSLWGTVLSWVGHQCSLARWFLIENRQWGFFRETLIIDNRKLGFSLEKSPKTAKFRD